MGEGNAPFGRGSVIRQDRLFGCQRAKSSQAEACATVVVLGWVHFVPRIFFYFFAAVLETGQRTEVLALVAGLVAVDQFEGFRSIR